VTLHKANVAKMSNDLILTWPMRC